MEKNIKRLGVHTSIAGGVHLALERAHELGCNTLQIFSHNPRQWLVKPITEESAALFRKSKKNLDIRPVFVHTSYLINLAASDKQVFTKSAELLKHEMDLADVLDAEYVILHTGSASGENAASARSRAVSALLMVSDQGQWKARLLLENTAGERGDISSRMEDLAALLEKSDSRLIAGICLDICHAFAAGYDLSSVKGAAGLADAIKKHLGTESVKLIHLNDSKKAMGSGVDRHEHLGEGFIGIQGLRRMVRHPAFKDVPLILETPKKTEDDDKRNLKTVRNSLL